MAEAGKKASGLFPRSFEPVRVGSRGVMTRERFFAVFHFLTCAFPKNSRNRANVNFAPAFDLFGITFGILVNH